jgi:serine/threonine-protein kinase
MGREPEAKALYQKVVDLIAADPTASSAQFLTVKGQALAHLGRTFEAVEAVEEASRLAPNDSGVAYETSLVYTLAGQQTSALVSAQKALKLGYEPRWFAFPWFDSLRTQPELRRLLATTPGA